MKLGFFILLIFIYSASATTYDFYPSNTTFATTLNTLNLQGGDIVNFHAATNGSSATYDFGAFGGTYNFTGTLGNPITVRAYPGDNIILTTSNPNFNIIQLTGNYFIFSGFEMIGNASATGAQAVRLMPGTNNAIIEKLKIHDLYQNAVTANTAPGVYSNITFRYNEIYRTSGAGECIYLGCQGQNSSVIPCYIYDSLLEFNYCHDTCMGPGGDCDAGSMGSGYQIKLGSYNNIVRNNVCNNTNTPCILMYDDANRGVNLIEGNVVLNTKSDSGIQVSAGAIIRNNIVVGSAVNGLFIPNNPNNIYQSLGIRNLMIEHNTIVLNSNNGLKFGATPTNTTVRNNAFLGNTAGDIWNSLTMAGVTFQNNVYNTGTLPAGIQVNGTIQVGATNTQLTAASTYNVYPLSTGGLVGKGAITQLAYDFNYNSRNACAPTIGAYEFSTSTNPGWTVIAGIKTVTGTQPACTPLSPCPAVCGAPTTTSPTNSPVTTSPTTPATTGPTTSPVTTNPVTTSPTTPATTSPTTPATTGPTTSPVTTTPVTTSPTTNRPTSSPTTSSSSSLHRVGAFFLASLMFFLCF